MNKTAGKEYSLSRESPCNCESDIYAKENCQCISTLAVFSWARVDYASRAAKNSPLGCFCAVFCDSAAAVRIHPPSPEKISAKQKIQYPVRILDFLVGAGGFEPPKLKAADLQSVPIGHSGTRPYTVFCSRGLPVYITTRERVCQLLFTAFSGKSGCWTAWFSRGDGRSGGSSWRGGGHAGR